MATLSRAVERSALFGTSALLHDNRQGLTKAKSESRRGSRKRETGAHRDGENQNRENV